MESLDKIRSDLGDCSRCKLCSTRNNIVFGSGNPNARWMVLGEGPGQEENLKGEPFVGRSGDLLNKLIEESGWARGDIYITNIVKCRPPNNRDPHEDEIEACRPFLYRQIEAIRPLVITTLGKPAANLLLNDNSPMYKLRGDNNIEVCGAKVIPTYHPAFVLRGNKKALDAMRQDFSLALAELMKQGIVPPAWK